MVEIYDDRVSIVSPGGVPKGITKKILVKEVLHEIL